MPPAIWLVSLPIGAVPVVYLLRRTKLGAITAALVALFLAWLTGHLSTGLVLTLLGRPIEMDRLSQVTLVLVFMLSAVLFLVLSFSPSFSARSIGGKLQEGERRIFYPVGLATLGLFGAASLSRHLGITAILIEVAAILTVFVIQGERLDSVRAALRFLIMISLATPLFLLAAWRIDLYQLSGVARSPEQTVLFVGFGFALWLGVVPFHGWLTATAAESSPTTAAFVLITFPIIAFSTFIHLLADLPWLVESTPLVRAMLVAGVSTAVVGGLLAAVQRSFSHLMGYTALYDLGCTLTLLGLGGRAAVITILVALIVRGVGLTLIAAGISTLRTYVISDGFTRLGGLMRRLPVATAGVLVGGLTLAGVPFTAGFATHWQLYHSATEAGLDWPALLLVLAGLGVTVGYLRGFRAALQPADTNHHYLHPPREPRLILVIIALLVTLCILWGVFPSLLIEWLQPLVAGIDVPI